MPPSRIQVSRLAPACRPVVPVLTPAVNPATHGRPAAFRTGIAAIAARAVLATALGLTTGHACAAQGGVQASSVTYAPTAAQLQTVETLKQASIDAFAPAEFARAGKAPLPYRLVSPLAPESGKKYPLVVIFHSSGGVGSDNLLPLNAFTRGFGSAESRRDFPAYVLVPQTPGRTATYEKDGRGVRISKAGADLADVMRLVEDIARHHPVDAKRIYAVGFSMGASAALDAAVASPGRFAAIVAMSGVPPERSLAKPLAGIPTLLIHGTADQENPYEGSQIWAKALAAAGGQPVFITYQGMDHRIAPELLTARPWREWMFQQKQP